MSQEMNDKAVQAVTSGNAQQIHGARTYSIEGTQGDEYTVTIKPAQVPEGRSNDPTCTCRAGQARRLCWHVIAASLLDDDHGLQPRPRIGGPETRRPAPYSGGLSDRIRSASNG